MVSTICRLVISMLVLGVGWASSRCAGQDLPPAPIPVVAGSAPGAVSLARPVPLPPPPGTPVEGPPACAPYEDANGPLLRGDPLLDRPEFPPPGWFAAVDIGIVKPHVKNALVNTVAVDGVSDQVSLPMAPLDWSGSPRLELGYRFPEGFGEVLLSYRSLVTEGMSILGDFDPLGDAVLKSRLNVNVGDLDYSSREFSLGPQWDMKWRVGVRLASVFFDSRATGGVLEQRTNNNFLGAGPHLGLDLWRYLGTPELALFGRVEQSAMLGKIHQAFEETLLDANGQPVLGGATNAEQTQAVPVLNVQVGLGWTPPFAAHWLRFTTGYEFEQWWYLGEVGASRAELTVNGVFVRGEWSF